MWDLELIFTTCSICEENYYEVNAENGTTNRVSCKRHPIQSFQCGHILCAECIADMHTAARSSESNGDDDWITCPFCNTSNAFHPRHQISCLLVKQYQELKQHQHDIISHRRNQHETRACINREGRQEKRMRVSTTDSSSSTDDISLDTTNDLTSPLTNGINREGRRERKMRASTTDSSSSTDDTSLNTTDDRTSPLTNDINGEGRQEREVHVNTTDTSSFSDDFSLDTTDESTSSVASVPGTVGPGNTTTTAASSSVEAMATYRMLTVLDAGIDDVNGDFVYAGDLDSAPRYNKTEILDGNEVTYSIYRSQLVVSGSRVWFISMVPLGSMSGTNAAIRFYWAPCNPEDGPNVPATGWRVVRDEGELPEPVVISWDSRTP